MPRIWLSGLPSSQTRSKIVPTTWKLEVLLVHREILSAL